MYYLYAVLLLTIPLHYIVKILAFETVTGYLLQTDVLIRSGKYTDGCTTPFKTYIHRWLNHSRKLCAAHDFGSLGLIVGVNPGIHNNLITWLAHMSQSNPVYWIWGTVVATVTLPWVVWRRNLDIEVLPFMVFHGMLLLFGTVFTLYYFYG